MGNEYRPILLLHRSKSTTAGRLVQKSSYNAGMRQRRETRQMRRFNVDAARLRTSRGQRIPHLLSRTALAALRFPSLANAVIL